MKSPLTWILAFMLCLTAYLDAMAVEGPKGTRLAKDIILVLDNSGSMRQNDPRFLTQDAYQSFIRTLTDEVRVALVIFDQSVDVAMPFTDISPTSKPAFISRLKQLTFKGHYTNTPAALERAIHMHKLHGRSVANKSIILMSDGVVDIGNDLINKEKERWLREELANDAAHSNIQIYGIAFSSRADYQLMQTLAYKTGGEYYRVFEAKDIPTAFQHILAKLQAKNQQPPAKIITAAETPALPDTRANTLANPQPVAASHHHKKAEIATPAPDKLSPTPAITTLATPVKSTTIKKPNMVAEQPIMVVNSPRLIANSQKKSKIVPQVADNPPFSKTTPQPQEQSPEPELAPPPPISTPASVTPASVTPASVTPASVTPASVTPASVTVAEPIVTSEPLAPQDYEQSDGNVLRNSILSFSWPLILLLVLAMVIWFWPKVRREQPDQPTHKPHIKIVPPPPWEQSEDASHDIDGEATIVVPHALHKPNTIAHLHENEHTQNLQPQQTGLAPAATATQLVPSSGALQPKAALLEKSSAGDGYSSSRIIKQKLTVIGRQDDFVPPGIGNIMINKPDISRVHSRLTFDSSSFWLEDLGSTNGTYVNDKRIGEKVRIKPGDVLRFCDEMFLFVFLDEKDQPILPQNL